MQEVIGGIGAGWRRAVSMFGFWTLATSAMVLFALVVLSPAYSDLLAARQKLARQEARVEAQRLLAERLQSVCEAMKSEPRYVALALRRELGYQRPGEEPLSVRPESFGLAVEVAEPRPTPQLAALVSAAQLFSRPQVRSPALTVSAVMIIMAVLFFEIPTIERKKRSPHVESATG